MNREIEFRGKRKDNNEWVYGYYQFCAKQHLICLDIEDGSYYEYEVIPETVGQYTGLKDKNGKKIFDGDIVKMHYFYEALHFETLGSMESENEVIGVIQYSHQYGVTLENDEESYSVYQYVQEPSEELEVIGTIFDKDDNNE